MKPLCVIHILLLLLLLSTVVSYGETMGLKQLVEYGLIYSPKLKTAADEKKISEYKLDNSFSQFFPSLDLSTVQGYQDGDPTRQPNPWGGKLSITLNEKVYDNGSQLIGYEVSKLNQKRAQIVQSSIPI